MNPDVPAHTLSALAIDDDPASLELVATCLHQHDIVVSTAVSGIDGLRLATENDFDVILCDLLMPGIDGFAVISELQRNPVTSKVPVLVVTAQDLSDADKQRLNGNILGIVHKGPALETGIREWLNRVAPPTLGMMPDAQ